MFVIIPSATSILPKPRRRLTGSRMLYVSEKWRDDMAFKCKESVLREIVNHFKINSPVHPIYREGGYFYSFKKDTIVKPLKQIDRLFDDNRHYLEKSAFGVCQQLG